jgi:hypothetical protein
MLSAPARAFVSWTAARRLQIPLPGAVSQEPLPGLASTASLIVVTVKVDEASAETVNHELALARRRGALASRAETLNLLRTTLPARRVRTPCEAVNSPAAPRRVTRKTGVTSRPFRTALNDRRRTRLLNRIRTLTGNAVRWIPVAGASIEIGARRVRCELPVPTPNAVEEAAASERAMAISATRTRHRARASGILIGSRMTCAAARDDSQGRLTPLPRD